MDRKLRHFKDQDRFCEKALIQECTVEAISENLRDGIRMKFAESMDHNLPISQFRRNAISTAQKRGIRFRGAILSASEK